MRPGCGGAPRELDRAGPSLTQRGEELPDGEQAEHLPGQEAVGHVPCEDAQEPAAQMGEGGQQPVLGRTRYRESLRTGDWPPTDSQRLHSSDPEAAQGPMGR